MPRWHAVVVAPLLAGMVCAVQRAALVCLPADSPAAEEAGPATAQKQELDKGLVADMPQQQQVRQPAVQTGRGYKAMSNSRRCGQQHAADVQQHS